MVHSENAPYICVLKHALIFSRITDYVFSCIITPMNKTSTSIDKWKNTAIIMWTVVGVFAVLWISAIILKQARVILPLIVYTMAIVYVLRPAVEILNGRGVPRGLAVVITYLVFIALLALAIWVLLPPVIKQFVSFAQDMPTRFYPKIQDFGQNLLGMYQKKLGGTFLDIDKFLKSFASSTRKFGLGIVASLPKATMDFFGGLLNLILAPILAFYILKDLPVIKETISGLIPKPYRDEVLTLINKTNLVLAGFLKGQLMVSVIVGLLVSIWLLVIGVKFSFVLGIISGALNIIPYLGPVLGGSIAVAVAAFGSTNPLFKIVLVVIGMFSIQQLDSAIISPQVMRRQVNLHPVLIVFALLIGGSLLGIMGMVLAIPTLAVAKVLLYHFVSKQDIF